MSEQSKCEHGHDCYDECAIDEDERTSCCGAFYTFSGDGDPYCKCCYALVTGGEATEGVTFDLAAAETSGKYHVEHSSFVDSNGDTIPVMTMRLKA